MVTTLIRETPAFGCYFATYDLLTSHVFYVSLYGRIVVTSSFLFNEFCLPSCQNQRWLYIEN